MSKKKGFGIQTHVTCISSVRDGYAFNDMPCRSCVLIQIYTLFNMCAFLYISHALKNRLKSRPTLTAVSKYLKLF